ncbi:uncharacterized protein Z518_09251 [Rhinocladiella mackenziei CBS 650.93]|uniref:Uncharacterized protein n=1 Tax=Rhinocladiella mackenziei CBS 650.93 TaxID=1442369 RepID=A0A0D2IYA0_9EURO|nr:uncharacterized protein Z518_09251 [Rhinocladiella mackenziei CBS 650.93]KIX01525.1 hypothetical protein Z518_09251 [Rhinocladiella mackenziei CBS 650.93]
MPEHEGAVPSSYEQHSPIDNSPLETEKHPASIKPIRKSSLQRLKAEKDKDCYLILLNRLKETIEERGSNSSDNGDLEIWCWCKKGDNGGISVELGIPGRLSVLLTAVDLRKCLDCAFPKLLEFIKELHPNSRVNKDTLVVARIVGMFDGLHSNASVGAHHGQTGHKLLRDGTLDV